MKLSTQEKNYLCENYSSELLHYGAHCLWGDTLRCFGYSEELMQEKYPEYCMENEKLRLIANKAQEEFNLSKKIKKLCKNFKYIDNWFYSSKVISIMNVKIFENNKESQVDKEILKLDRHKKFMSGKFYMSPSTYNAFINNPNLKTEN